VLLSKNVHRKPSPLDTQDDIIIEVGMNNKGSVLILMVIVIALVIVMGLSVLNTAAKQYEIKKFNIDSKESFYVSETGINEAYVRTCDLMDESIEAALQVADDYLAINPSDLVEAENIYRENYMTHLRANIYNRIETEINPSIKIWNENLLFIDNELRLILKSSYMHENNVYKISGADFVICVPDYDEVSTTYDVRNYIRIQNWNN
jgi:predicted acyltransferase (DUF342 family)